MSDYWGPKEQKTAPKRVKVVPKPVASVRETQVKATIDRIFSSSGEERNAEVRRLASFCPPGFLWNPRDTDRLVAGFGKLIDGLGPNETEAVKGMAKRIFSTRSGVNGGTLNIISEMCDSKTIRDRMNAGQEVTAADVYYSLVDPKARWRTIGGVPLERIIRRPNVEGYAAPEAVAAPRMESEAPRVSKEKPAEAIVKIDGKEAASDLDKIMVDAIKNKNKLIDKVESKVNVAGVEASFDNLETAYANLKKYLETGEVNVETLGKLMYVFYGRLGEYSKSAANAYTAYKASQKRGLVESLTDIGAVPLITGVVGTIFLKKPPTTFGRMLARNAAVITGGGLVGGTVEWAGDNLIRSIWTGKGDIKTFFKKQRETVEKMKKELDDLEKQVGKNPKMAAQIKYARASLANAKISLDNAEKRAYDNLKAKQKQNAPDWQTDVLKSAAAVTVIGLLAPKIAPLKKIITPSKWGENWELRQQLKTAESNLEKAVASKNAANVRKAQAEVKKIEDKMAGKPRATREAAEMILKESEQKKMGAAVKALNGALASKDPAKIKAAKSGLEKLTGREAGESVDELIKRANKALRKAKGR